MKKRIILGILFIIATLMAVNVSAQATCGGATPCSCGNTLTASRTMTGADNLTGCGSTGLNIFTADLTWDCNGLTMSGTGNSYGVNVNADGVTVHDCIINNFNYGITMEADGGTFTGNTINDMTGRGMWVVTASDNLIDDNIINDTADHGIYVDNCFLAGTSILMADGSYKNIEDVQEGDYVTSYDDNTGALEKAKVRTTFSHDDTPGYLIINNRLRLTPNHPMYVNGEVIPAGKIVVGDSLLDKDGNSVLVTSIEAVDEIVSTYNLEVAGNHNYFAEDILTHNKCPRVFTYNGNDYEFDMLLNVAQFTKREEAEFSYPSKHMEEPSILVEYDPDEINYVDYLQLKVTDTNGDDVVVTTLNPVSCIGTDNGCDLSVLEAKDEVYLILDEDNTQFYIEFEELPALDAGYTRVIEVFSSGYQDRLAITDYDLLPDYINDFIDEYMRANPNSNNTITNNKINNTGGGSGCGISLNREDENTIEDNELWFNYRGICLYSSWDNTLTDNEVFNSTSYGVYMTDGDANTITGGEISDNDGAGIYMISGSDNNTISDIEMHDDTGGAINIYSSQGNTIEDNNIHNNCGLVHQIYLTNTYNTLIQNNDINDGTGIGIDIVGSDYVRILNNDILRNGNAGVYINGQAVGSDHVIRGNTISNNGGDGIYMTDEDNVTIDDNTISNNGNNGISLVDSILNFITGNTIEDNTEDGLNMDGNSDFNTVNSNRMCDNLGGGGMEDQVPLTDIHNEGTNNTGDSNTCDTATGWNDDGTENCTRVCSWTPPSNGGGGSNKPPEQEIDLGDNSTTKTKRGTKVVFNYGGAEYGMMIEGYGSNYEFLTIKIGRETYTIGLGETIHIDLDGDGEPDISVTYEGVNANTVPSEVMLKVEPYVASTTSSQPVALTLSEDPVTGEPIIVVKVVEKVTATVLEDITSPVDVILKKINVNRVKPTLDMSRMAGGILLLALSIMGVLGLGFFIKEKKH